MITRNAGTPVTIGGIPYLVGSGYCGLTDELDKTVQRQAELLAQTFNRDVEIRFNSDRESGGAWLVNSLQGFGGNCQVGFSAGLRPIRPKGITDNEYFQTWRQLPKELYIETYVKESALKNPALATEDFTSERVSLVLHATVEDGLAWLTKNVDTDKILY